MNPLQKREKTPMGTMIRFFKSKGNLKKGDIVKLNKDGSVSKITPPFNKKKKPKRVVLGEGYPCTHNEGEFHKKPCNGFGSQYSYRLLKNLEKNQKVRLIAEFLEE